jgi:uncharacterized protein YjbJ (UPF0337 family)
VIAGRSDKGKGRIKEAMGALTENRRLKERGRDDRAKGSLKKGFSKVRRKLR